MREITDHEGRKFKSCAEMCNFWGVDLELYNSRVHSRKWAKERALTTPVKTKIKLKLPTTDHQGRTFESFEQLAKHYTISPKTLKNRLKSEMSLEQALTMPVRSGPHVVCKDHLGNVYWAFTDMCSIWGVKYSTFIDRLNRGLSIEECLKKGRICKRK